MIRNILLTGFSAVSLLFLVNTASAESCRDLRLACEHKDQLGERGQGNCRRYREQCGDEERGRSYCEDLRYRCMHKEELGETGQGNCQRYRSECRSGN